MNNHLVWARAHTNIALVKYWGKLDSQLIIPQNSSLSLTLDHFYTDTGVKFDATLSIDQLWIDGNQVPMEQKVKDCLDAVRSLAGFHQAAIVKSYNHVPNSAGLASSASAFAALATAACKAANLVLNGKQLSRIARRGSGSATRSIFGGFVEWHGGNSDLTSYAEVVADPVELDIEMITVILSRKPKKISSRDAMQSSVETSPYYPAWRNQAHLDLIEMKRAINTNDFKTIGHIAETNAMRMHALTLSADPSFTYLNADSLAVIELVRSLRMNGIDCYFTMDAGPNVKIICQQLNESIIITHLQQLFADENIVVCKPGPGVKIINDPRK
ncbi:diphosphomevalonate decarboxylase [Nicoliella spurrieriana]|uniref:diphosphomevalonate decarboxylase n=1 Tax=Nicoliella spurrieriana TaxID=2925830 RepID=A0A976RRM3_9LACO|nr:diphosphomevalonate decarboxylase [Nicoliella spurrieriana]UQS86615.1 diphosphomevalonate decarboxylase [Nicoliella spurrieriana]